MLESIFNKLRDSNKGISLKMLVAAFWIPKETLGLLYTNIAQLMAYTAVVYVAAYLAIMLPGLLTYCRG